MQPKIEFDEIVDIKSCGVEPVYDLTVDHPNHTFFANDVSVSNCSHAFSYAIDSYYCAWLLTHYEEEWLSAYMESMSGNPDDKAYAFSEIKSMGYEIVPIDINHATLSWRILPGKKFMPSFLTCKGIGQAAAQEVLELRPYSSLEEFLWNEDGTWRHSKFNKRAIEALIKVDGFRSLDCIGPDKVFASKKHMYHVLIECNDQIRKSSKKDPQLGRKNMYEIARTTREELTEDWTRSEMVQFQVELFGSIDVSTIITPDLYTRLLEKGVRPLDQLDTGEKDISFFVGQSLTTKKTKNGKTYGEIMALSPSGKVQKLKVWGWKEPSMEPFTVFLAEVSKDEFGLSTNSWKLKKLGV